MSPPLGLPPSESRPRPLSATNAIHQLHFIFSLTITASVSYCYTRPRTMSYRWPRLGATLLMLFRYGAHPESDGARLRKFPHKGLDRIRFDPLLSIGQYHAVFSSKESLRGWYSTVHGTSRCLRPLWVRYRFGHVQFGMLLRGYQPSRPIAFSIY